MLTRKQVELLRFIHERLKEAGVPPSFDEMKDALDLRSKSGIHRLITALEERGFIRRLPNRARAIEVIKLPEFGRPWRGAGRARGFTPSVIEGNLGRVRAQLRGRRSGRPIAVPVMGRIAAGTPIEAIQTRSHVINMPPDLLPAGEHFALEVRGDSMIDAGILDGDIALIKRTEAADTGDIVVALIDDEEATLKRFRRRGASIALEPANTVLRGAHPAAEPRAHPGQAGRAVSQVFSSRAPDAAQHGAEWCAADPGPAYFLETGVPVLQRTASRCAVPGTRRLIPRLQILRLRRCIHSAISTDAFRARPRPRRPGPQIARRTCRGHRHHPGGDHRHG